MKLSIPSWVAVASAGAIAAAVVLMAIRAESALSFVHPLLVVTSGAEEETIMGVYRAAVGERIYVDPFRVPFAAAYYNWLFYQFFGGIGRAAMAVFDLPLIWLPTIGRVTALAGCALLWLVSALAVGRMNPGAPVIGRWHNAAVAAWIAIGPLVGYWAMAISPDVWPTALTAASALSLMMYYDRWPVRAVVLATVLSLLAWSFKQTYVFSALALGLFLLARGDWRSLGVAVFLHIAALAAVFALGTSEFRAALLSGASTGFALWQLERNLVNLAIKIVPLAVAAAVALISIRSWRTLTADTPLLLAVSGLLATLPALPASAKIGAAENYFLPLGFFLGLLAARAGGVAAASGWPRVPSLALIAGWTAGAIASVLVVVGVTGSASVAHFDQRYQAQKGCIADLPAPMYSVDPYLSLPWMHPAGPHFVPAYNYSYAALPRHMYEGGGIAGLVETRYFATIVMPAGLAPVSVDGTALPPDYERIGGVCAGLDIYGRRSSPSPS